MHDLIVAGAGPAGTSAAYAAARAGLDVLVLEREKTVAETVRTSGVTWIRDMEEFGIPPDCYNAVRNFEIWSPSNVARICGKKPTSAVLDVRKTYRWLAKRAESAGAKIATGTAVRSASRGGGRMDITAVTGCGAKRHSAKMAIDASGFRSVLAEPLGHVDRWNRYGAGAEYEAEVGRVDPDTWWLMVGQRYSPAGYAWMFPLDDATARIGVGVAKPDSAADPLRLLDGIIRDRAGPLAELGEIRPFETHYGLIPNGGITRRTVFDRLLLVGDSAGQANPLVLEGIRYAMRFGLLAGEVAATATAAGDVSKESLAPYESAWRKAVASRISSAGRVQNRWLGLDDREWDREVSMMSGLSAEEFLDFVRADFNLGGIVRLAARHPAMAARHLLSALTGR